MNTSALISYDITAYYAACGEYHCDAAVVHKNRIESHSRLQYVRVVLAYSESPMRMGNTLN